MTNVNTPITPVPPQPAQSSPDKPQATGQKPLTLIAKIRSLPKSALLLIILGILTVVILLSALIYPKKTSTNRDISTDNIPEPNITFSDPTQTKQTPFTSEIVDFKKNAVDLDYNYPKYNLPIVDTKIDLTK